MNAIQGVMLVALVGMAAPAAADIRVVADVDYVAGADYADGKDRLDIYVPDGAKRAPVIISLHGGGLMGGDRKAEAFVGRRFASAGFVTVIPSYRLSPGVSHPAHVQDVAAAIAWARAHIDRHGGDPDRLFVIGHSAGAYLAALVATDARYLAAHKLSPGDITGVVPVAGFFWVERKGVAPDRPKHVWGSQEDTWRAASPARHLQRPVPPMLLIYADGDDEWRRMQNDEMGSALRAAGQRDVAVHEIKQRTHTTVWTKMQNREVEEVSALVVAFVNRLTSSATSR